MAIDVSGPDRGYLRALGERIRWTRHEAHMNQVEFSSLIGMSFDELVSIEAGEQEIDADQVRLLCDGLGVSPDFLLDVSGSLFIVKKARYEARVARSRAEEIPVEQLERIPKFEAQVGPRLVEGE